MLSTTVVEQAVTLTRDNTTGWTARVALPRLGPNGRLSLVQVREDAVNADATECTVYVLTADTATPTAAQIVYQASAVALTSSATAASLNDPVGDDTPADYALPESSTLYTAANITATAGGGGATTDLHVIVRARI